MANGFIQNFHPIITDLLETWTIVCEPTVILSTEYSLVWRSGAVGSDVGPINEVTLRRARLVLGCVTVLGFNSRCGKFISV